MTYRKQAADVALETAERIAALPDVVSALESLGVSVPAMVSHAEREYARRATDTGRTYTAPDRVRAPCVTSADRRTQFGGASSEVASYGVLDGAPVGAVPTLRGEAREAHAALQDARWAQRNERAERANARRKRGRVPR